MSDAWPWLALAGLGAFHGLNPAMGWLFAVALGLQRESMRAVLWSLVPIALGHALSIALVVAAVAVLQALIDFDVLQWGAALLLIGFGELVLWSFLMATAHGAGLMIVPVLLHLPIHAGHVAHLQLDMGVAAVALHTVAMLAVAAAVALVVYRWVGLAFLRRGWLNVDLIWAIVLIAAGAVLLIPGLS